MARVALIDDYLEYAEMAAAPLRVAGHETMAAIVPIDFERILKFEPNVISVGLYRKEIAFNRPIEHWEEDVLGYEPLKEMERYPAIGLIPIILIGSALEEQDVPTTVNYDLFLSFPRDLHLYLPKVEELASTVKTNRKISGYVCPWCGSRLVYHRAPARDLFCPRCHTAVAIVDRDRCLMMVNGAGPQVPSNVALLQPRRPVDRKGASRDQDRHS